MESRPLILIVDDAPANIRVLMESLSSDHRVTAATTGAAALDLAARSPGPDLILLDVNMPGMDGYEVCERLKTDPATRDIPVIFVTALTEAGEEAQGLALGAVDYITKPVNPELVRSRVRNQVELKLHRDRLEEMVEEKTRELTVAISEKERLAAQLELARDLQQAMLPPRDFRNDRCEIAALVEPATHVGGDLYDYYPVDRQRILFFVGDVSGKGVPAALFMVRALTVIRTIARKQAIPAEILTQANLELCRDNDDSYMFVTASCGILDFESGEVSIASAGHELPVTIGPGESCGSIAVPGGPPLGVDEAARYPESRHPLSTDQVLLLYTDGIPDATSQDGEFFTEERFRKSLPAFGGRSASEVRDGLLETVREFTSGAPQSDDITLLAIHRLP